MQYLKLSVLSDQLKKVQDTVEKCRPGTEMLIGGGSARDILDHILFQRPLATRDVDLFFVHGTPVKPDFAKRFFRRLEQKRLGELKTADLRVKKRCNPSLPQSERFNYVTGYGAHFFHPDFPIISITWLHTDRDLKLNGLMNIDKIYIRVPVGQTLQAISEKIVGGKISYHDLAANGIIIDESNGYPAWVESRPELLNWYEVERSPAQAAIRIIRGYAKAGHTKLPESVTRRFQKLIEESPEVGDPVEFRRGIVKVFSDRYWHQELKSLARMGVLHQISGDLAKVMVDSKFPPSQSGDWRMRWNGVLKQLPIEEGERLKMDLAPAMETSFN